MYHIGIDLGGSKIEGILLDDNFQVLHRKRIPTPKENYTEILQSIKHLIDEFKQDQCTIGVCTPGAISKKTGLIKNSNTKCLIGKSLKEDLEKTINQKISMDNDANCFALAEAQLGCAKNYSVVFGVIMGTGVGGGIIIDGSIHHGRNNIAGEWGHHVLHQKGLNCYCGKKGCVEMYISGPALEKRWTEITGKTQTLSKIVKNLKTPDELTWKNEFLENFGSSLANVIDIVDPDAIVLGGGVSNIDFLYDEGKKSVHDKVFSDSIDTPILKNSLGDSAGVFGACLIQ